MTTDVLEILAEALGTFDRRLSDIDIRFVDVEKSIADDAQASEDTAKSVQKLQELYVTIDKRLEDVVTMLGHYVEETRALRRDARNLISEVRAKSG